MRNTINVSYQTKVDYDFLRESVVQNKAAEKKKEQKIEEQNTKEKEEVSETFHVEIVSANDMTLEEYKQYIYDVISKLPIHPSNRNDFIAVQISDAGFRAMKSDPEYEKWVLDTLQKDFMAYDPWGGRRGKYVIHSFGAAKEAYRGESWRMNCEEERECYNRKAENSFWERRAKRRKQLKEEYEKLLQKRLAEKKIYEKKVYERKVQQRKYEGKIEENKIKANTIEITQQTQKWQNKMQQASSIYEANSIAEEREEIYSCRQ